MTNIKKINLCFICVLLLFSLCSCGALKSESREQRLNREMKNADLSNKTLTKEIIACFKEKNKENLKQLFSIKNQEMEDFDMQIEEALAFIDSDILSYNEQPDSMGESSSTRFGTVTSLTRDFTIHEIATQNKDNYTINVSYCAANEDTTRQGVSTVAIAKKGGKEIKIGYDWPSYSAKAKVLSKDVVSAIGSDNKSQLKALFSEEALKNKELDKQIELAFAFFEGQPTFGKVTGSSVKYDGRHDMQTETEEKERVKNNKPVYTYLFVKSDNIETDKGRVYQLELHTYLLQEETPELEGVSQIILKEGNKKCVIGENIVPAS